MDVENILSILFKKHANIIHNSTFSTVIID